MKVLIAFCVALLFAVPVAAAPEPPDLELRHHQMLYTVVLVQSRWGSGSGTVIYSEKHGDEWQSYVLTNHHVVRSAIKVEEVWDPRENKDVKRETRSEMDVRWFDYNNLSHNIGTTGMRASIVAYDEKLDLALLRLADREQGVAPVAYLIPEEDDLHLFERVWAVGAGLGEPPFATEGHVSYLDKEYEGRTFMLSSAPIIFGNSGGALYRWSPDRDRYELVGVPSAVSVAGFTAVTHMAWSIPMETVRGFLEDNCFGPIVGRELAADDCKGLGEPKPPEKN